MSALLVFPLVAILWMMVNVRLGLVVDQPPMAEDPSPNRAPSYGQGVDALTNRA